MSLKPVPQNTAKIEREEISDHPAEEFATRSLINAGQNLAPYGFEYQGSVATHFYREKKGILETGKETYAFINQTHDLAKVQEGQADAGLKELRRTMMQAYGREAPRERK